VRRPAVACAIGRLAGRVSHWTLRGCFRHALHRHAVLASVQLKLVWRSFASLPSASRSQPLACHAADAVSCLLPEVGLREGGEFGLLCGEGFGCSSNIKPVPIDQLTMPPNRSRSTSSPACCVDRWSLVGPSGVGRKESGRCSAERGSPEGPEPDKPSPRFACHPYRGHTQSPAAACIERAPAVVSG